MKIELIFLWPLQTSPAEVRHTLVLMTGLTTIGKPFGRTRPFGAGAHYGRKKVSNRQKAIEELVGDGRDEGEVPAVHDGRPGGGEIEGLALVQVVFQFLPRRVQCVLVFAQFGAVLGDFR